MICPLTAGIDNVAGTAGNDTINALMTTAATPAQTLGNTDSIVGGAGTDTLNADISGTASFKPAVLSGVELVNVTFTGAGTFNVKDAAGLTTLASAGSTADATFSNIASTSIGLVVRDTAQSTDFQYQTAATAGTADAVTLTVSNIAQTTTNGTDAITVAGVETLNIVSTNSASVIDTLTATSATTLNISGDADITIGASNGVATKILGAAATGGISMSSSVATEITGGAGNDSFTQSAASGDLNINSGAGNDTITITHYTDNDTVAGGEGTDRLVLSSSVADDLISTSAATKNLSGVEILRVSDELAGTLNVSKYVGIVDVELADGTDGSARTINFAAGSAKLTFRDGSSNDLGAGLTVDAGGTAATDALTVSVVDANENVLNGQALTISDFETINIGATLNAQTIGGITVTNGMSNEVVLNITGAKQITTGSVTGVTSINGSALTVVASGDGLYATAGAAMTLIGSGAKDSLTGSSGNDVISGGASNDTLAGGGGNDQLNGEDGNDDITGGTGRDTISGGAGNDTIAGAGGNDVITGGDGNDSIDISGAASATANVDGGAGNDSVVVTGRLSKTQTLAGGEGTDTLTINQATDLTTTVAGLTTAEKAAFNEALSGFEVIVMADELTGTLDTSFFDGISNVKLHADGSDAAATISGVSSGGEVEYTAAAGAATDTLTVTVKDAAAGSADAFNVKLAAASGTPDFGVIAIANVETLTVNSTRTTTGTSTLNTIDITNAALKTLTVTGAVASNVTLVDAAEVQTIDASAATGALTVDAAIGTLAITATGTAAADNITTGGGADVINTGIGNDTISSGGGADSIVAGFGDDQINAGAGADTIDAGAGNDTILTSSGADVVDGGAGTDTLRINSALAADISGQTITNVETLDLNGYLTTVTANQFDTFTTYSNATAGILFSAPGTLTANTAITTYTLANGTNTFTANTVANYSATGGTGADTFNFASASLTSDDTINGGAGTDTLNVTGNTAVTLVAADVANVENVTFSNTSTNVSFTLGATDYTKPSSGTTTIRVDATSLTSGTLMFDAALESEAEIKFIVESSSTGADTIYGGTGADTLSSGAGNDLLYSVDGADELIGGTGNDTYTLINSADAVNIVESASQGTDDTLVLTLAGAFNAKAITVNGAADFQGATGLGIEHIVVTTGQTTTFTGAQLSGNTISINESGSGTAAIAIEATAGAATDYSNLTFTLTKGDATDGAFDGGTDTIAITGADTTAESITGTSVADSISGGSGTDTLIGGGGADTLLGGAGADTLTGGAGSDAFKFSGITTTLNGADTVTDFAIGTSGDVLDFRGVGFALSFANNLTGTAIGLNTTAELADQANGITVADNKAFFAEVADSDAAKIDTAAEIVTALADTGILDAVDIAQAASNVAVLFVKAATGTVTYVYGFTDNAAAASVDIAEIALIGTITSAADGTFITTNFAFAS